MQKTVALAWVSVARVCAVASVRTCNTASSRVRRNWAHKACAAAENKLVRHDAVQSSGGETSELPARIRVSQSIAHSLTCTLHELICSVHTHTHSKRVHKRINRNITNYLVDSELG